MYDAFKIVYDATEIYAKCEPVYSDLTANTFNAYKVQTGDWLQTGDSGLPTVVCSTLCYC